MTKPTYETLGDKLKAMRKNSGKTQKDLAHILGVCVRTVQDYEHSVSDIPTPKMIKACIYCKVVKRQKRQRT
jgi:transcriptional regulator with XRE-family HTH domain